MWIYDSAQKRPDNLHNTSQRKPNLRKHLSEEATLKTLPTTLLQIYCELKFNSKVISKSIRHFPGDLHVWMVEIAKYFTLPPKKVYCKNIPEKRFLYTSSKIWYFQNISVMNYKVLICLSFQMNCLVRRTTEISVATWGHCRHKWVNPLMLTAAKNSQTILTKSRR